MISKNSKEFTIFIEQYILFHISIFDFNDYTNKYLSKIFIKIITIIIW